MTLIRHCIVDTTTNKVVNIIDYEILQTGIPNGLESNFLCVASETGEIGGTYENGNITNPAPPPLTPEQIAQVADQEAQVSAKASALSKLSKLGLTEDEINALIG